MIDFLEIIDNCIKFYNEYVGGYLILFLLVPIGIYFLFKFKLVYITKLKLSFELVLGKHNNSSAKGDVNHFKALTTALSATVGTGNIVGVALAIYYGGPGAIFWMWVTGFLGMGIKLAECTLANKYRTFNKDGTVSGGPMYYIELGLKDRFGKLAKYLAIIFAFAAVLCSFGTGNMAQSNSMTDVLASTYQIPTWISSAIITSVVLLIIVGGLKRIANVTSRLVPFMAALYFICSILIIGAFYSKIPGVFTTIISDAFTGTAASGGFIGSAFIMTLTYGVRRGLFSNEAGQGSAPIAHAAAKTKDPVKEGLVGSIEPLIDTLIICTMTALVILCTGAWQSGEKGVSMTLKAFEIGLGAYNIGFLSKHIVAISLILFAFSTVIAWSYYGSRAVQYISNEKYIKPYYFIYGAFVFLGGVWGIDLVWHFVDMVITFMTIPNLIAILLLSGVVKKELDRFFNKK
jgi:AGCS family alanine or glycine:cation symporter